MSPAKAKRVHFVTWPGYMPVARCGAPWAGLYLENTTMRENEVTCERCLAVLRKEAANES